MKFRLVVALCFGVVINAGCGAGVNHSEVRDEVRLKGFERAVHELSNRNQEPEFVGRPGLDYPTFGPRYDWEEVARIVPIIHDLTVNAVDAWEVLLEHIDDPRYCVTIQTDQSGYNATIGNVCSDIIMKTLTGCYIHRISFYDATSYWEMASPDFIPTDDFGKWCRNNCPSGERVWETQVRLCEWAIEKLRNSEPVPSDDTKESLDAIKLQIAKLKETRKPVRSESIFGDSTGPFSEESAAVRLKQRVRLE